MRHYRPRGLPGSQFMEHTVEQLVVGKRYPHILGIDIDIGKCHDWPWALDKQHIGYGRVSYKGKIYSVRDIVFVHEHGRWPEDGKQLNHICIGNYRCCRLSHLYEGTALDNMVDRSIADGNFLLAPKVREARKQGYGYDDIRMKFGLQGAQLIADMTLRRGIYAPETEAQQHQRLKGLRDRAQNKQNHWKIWGLG